ncbi:hypothetical protein [Aestuariibaculum suncheonense]|uniref:Uncharacterized protein n=1 Tax=Aestuariibaculum suncheonense TaxID=1028745 RepID=A0A8J6Q4S0_9FLAO|nr:hypothetical protein [Aestuariibaculum suncheonense]MBD0835043.1 hypothetical protein [Aestuariibaculum suncheonense]
MEDFLLKNYFLLTTIVECLAALTGLILYKRYKHTAAKYFIWFLWYLSICDFASNYTRCIKDDGLFSFVEGTVFINNYWFGTLYWKIGAIVFVSFYFRKILIHTVFKKTIKYATYIFVLMSFIWIFTHWEAYFKVSFPIISVNGAFIVFMCIMFYFIEVLLSDKILNFYKLLNFYISFSFFIWWIITTPFVFYGIYFGSGDKVFRNLQNLIYLIANMVMYLTITFALIWCRPEGETEV